MKYLEEEQKNGESTTERIENEIKITDCIKSCESQRSELHKVVKL